MHVENIDRGGPCRPWRASGNHGGFVRCDYMMSSAALGWGSCTFASGARYDMHISQ